jgi:predicted metal-binding protein
MTDRSQLERLFAQHGIADFKWINPEHIVVSQWVRMKCAFGCSEYGKNACCPPNTPSVSECRQFFDEYQTAAIFHFEKSVDKPEDRKLWSKQVNQGLSKLECEVFLAGYQKAFLLLMDSCQLCTDCSSTRAGCKLAQIARPAPEAMAVDVFATARACGFPIQVLSDYTQAMNRYAFLLIE